MNTDRFKFRVWDKITKQYDNYSYLSSDGQLVTNDRDGMMYPADYNETLVLEQCTGLRDKNGKLIYDGDVIENTFRDGTKTQWFIVWNEELKYVKLNIQWFKKEKLELGKNFSMAKHIVVYSCGIKKEPALKHEIIGNIHDPKFGIEIPEGDSK